MDREDRRHQEEARFASEHEGREGHGQGGTRGQNVSSRETDRRLKANRDD